MIITNLINCDLRNSPTGEKFAVIVGRHEKHGSAKHHTVAVVELALDATSDEHFHKEREESYLVVSGNGEARIDGQIYSLKVGDLISAAPAQRHQFKNIGSESFRYAVITAPCWSPEDSWK